MKRFPNWKLFLYWGGYCLFVGWKGIYLFPFFVVVCFVTFTVLNFLFAMWTANFRAFLVQKNIVKSDGVFIKIFCKLKLHTYGTVTVEDPRTECAKLWLERRHLKIGRRKSLCCGKEQVVSTCPELNGGGREYWDEEASDSYKDYLGAQNYPQG